MLVGSPPSTSLAIDRGEEAGGTSIKGDKGCCAVAAAGCAAAGSGAAESAGGTQGAVLPPAPLLTRSPCATGVSLSMRS